MPEISITSVDPSWLYNGDYEQITVVGENFYPQVELEVREAGGRLDRQFAVGLELDGERYPLESVELADYQHLTAFVPMGLPPARYTVEVTSPMEQLARFPRGFTITDTRADHLVVSAEQVAVPVKEEFQVHMALEDPDGEVLEQAIEVVLSITSKDGNEIDGQSLEVDVTGFDEAQVQEIDGDITVSLNLRAGDLDRNYVTLLGHTPDTLILELSVPDEDSVILPGEDEVVITTGSLNSVQLVLPGEDYSTTAGEPFDLGLRLVDEFGNLIEYANATLVLYEQCGSASQAVEFREEHQVVFTATGATGEDCPENRVLASGTVSGSSAGFQVLPDDAVEYDVSVYPRSVVAWDDTALVTVRALDSYGNLVVDYGESWFEEHGKELQLELVDELAGLDPGPGYGWQSCPGFDLGYQICQARLTKAGTSNWITATGEDGLDGKSEDFEVLESDLADFALDHDTPPFVAGVDFSLRVRPTDAYGNTILVDPGVDPFEFTGNPHEVNCDTPTATTTTGEWSFTCTATVTEEEQFLTVSVPSLDASVSSQLSEGFEVQNGALGQAVFNQPTGSTQVAGQDFTIAFELFDAFGNPYLVQSVSAVDLTDCTGSLEPVTASFDSAGAGSVTASITQSAQGCIVTALDGGVVLGSSTAFDISNGPLDSMIVEIGAPWVFLDESIDVEIRAVDVYGNAVVGFSEQVTLESTLGSAPNVVVGSFEDGIATVQPEFDTAVLADTLVAESDGGIVVSSAPLDVLDRECGGVLATLLVDGDTEPVMCLTTGSVSSTLDASRSSGSVSGYHFDDGAGNLLRITASTTTATWSTQAAYLIQAVAFDASACGSLDQVVAYVAEPDGEPAGPVTVTPQDSVRLVGSSTDGTTQVDVEAFDCARDVAAYGTLYVRTTIGEITAGASTSGQGLALVLDSLGQGQFTWSVASEQRGGQSDVLVGRPGAVALGTSSIVAAGDDASPVVLELDPFGASAEITDTFSLRFDDVMLASSLSSSTVSLSDSLGPLSIDSISMVDGDIQAEITLSSSVDLASDVFVLDLSDQVRDSSGNRLDGDWDGTSSAFTVELGAVVDSAPDVTSCVPDTTTLRPDGDDQPATDEADFVEVSLSADAIAALWLLEVYDGNSTERGRFWHTAGTSVPDPVLWDARDQDGVILPNGSYTLVFSAADAALNLGASCEVDVLIDNSVVEVP